jgi:hypothetical protein
VTGQKPRVRQRKPDNASAELRRASDAGAVARLWIGVERRAAPGTESGAVIRSRFPVQRSGAMGWRDLESPSATVRH